MRPRNVTGRRGVREPGPQVITFGVEKLVLPQAKQSEPQAGRTIAANSKFPVYTKQSNWPYLPRDATANERCQRNIGLPPAVSVDENRVGDQVIPNRGRPPGVTPRRSGHRQPVSAQRSLASSRSRDTWRRVQYFHRAKSWVGERCGGTISSTGSMAARLSAIDRGGRCVMPTSCLRRSHLTLKNGCPRGDVRRAPLANLDEKEPFATFRQPVRHEVVTHVFGTFRRIFVSVRA
jgi:hypothetical protein